MSRLLVFTENYGIRAGGASYIVDLCNSVNELYDDLVLTSNPRGYSPDISQRVLMPHTLRTVQICTADRLGADIGSIPHLPTRWWAHTARRIGLARERQLFAFNVFVCRRTVRKFRPSAVLAFNGGYPAGRSVLAMAVAAHREGVPVALCVVSLPGERPSGKEGVWETRMDEMVAESVEVIIVNAVAIGTALCQLRGFPESKIRVVHNALPDAIPALSFGSTSGRLRIGCISRMEKMKGIHFLVEAFAGIVSHNRDVELMLVGEGPERSAIEQLVRDLDLTDHVIMTGHYDGDVNALVHTFDIYAFPSLWEGLPYALLEAMRAERPIVATDVGGVSEAITDGATGLLVEPGSAEALERAILRLFDDAGLRTRLAKAARARFLEDFSVAAMQRHTEAAFRQFGLTDASTRDRFAAPEGG